MLNIYRLLEYPWFYKLTVGVFSMGGRARKISRFIDNLLNSECRGRVLELGSGTCQFRSLFLKYVENYVATDINLKYLKDSQQQEPKLAYVVSDASRLPFALRRFDRIFALYLYHHLSDRQTLNSLKEMVRCLKPAGKIIIVDNFLPEHWYDLIAWAVARLDRGQHIRRRRVMLDLIRQSAQKARVEEFNSIPGSWPYVMSAYIITLDPQSA
jgi:ubiquinone/menaquinone biosynthesis C-methylase UbiE